MGRQQLIADIHLVVAAVEEVVVVVVVGEVELQEATRENVRGKTRTRPDMQTITGSEDTTRRWRAEAVYPLHRHDRIMIRNCNRDCDCTRDLDCFNVRNISLDT